MRAVEEAELPPKQKRALVRAIRIEWLSITIITINIVLMYFVMGSSQAMKTAWLDDVLSLTPPIAFLVAERVRHRRPTKRFPCGFHRVVSIAFLVASTALFAIGGYLLVEALYKLAIQERPSIGTMEVFGTTLWAGWPMCAVVVWRGFAAAFVARLKLPLGKVLHNKVIHADAAMNKADWLTSVSTVVGLLGTGLGFWWADAVAAAVISTDILKDGYTHLKSAVSDLIDRIPETIESGTEEPINAKVKEYIESQDWIEKSIVRLHEQGNFFFGEAYVVPKSEDGLIQKIDKALHDIRHMDWRMRDFAMTPVPAHELSSHETDHRNRK